VDWCLLLLCVKGGFDLFLFDKQLQKDILQIQEKNTNTAYLLIWLGYEYVCIPYVRKKRDLGVSRWTLSKKIKLFVDSFVSFSFFPIRIISISGIGLGIVAIFYAIYLIICKILGLVDVQGWTTMMLVFLLVSSFQMVALGIIGEYIHSNRKVAVLVELLCETDFVARNEQFVQLGHDIAMHIAATNPSVLTKEEISEASKAKAMEVFLPEVEGKPEELKEKILAGKLDAFFNEQVLLEQPFIKNGDVTIKSLIEQGTQKFGEKIAITRFVRFSIK